MLTAGDLPVDLLGTDLTLVALLEAETQGIGTSLSRAETWFL